MLSQRDNQYVTRTGPGTPVGELFRRFWLPALVPLELPEPDCPPIRLTLLNEKLVAFRDTNGQVGIVAENCPHCGASLFFGRNEEAGLRCVYHGWKFSASGECVDMPNEPAESDFKHKVRATAYPTREWGDVVWVYMGPSGSEGPLPQFEWARVPSDQRCVGKYVVEANYLQVLEGSLDSAHLGFLHTWLNNPPPGAAPRNNRMAQSSDKTPRFFTHNTDFGVTIAARRNALDEDSYYWRLTQMLLPAWAMIPATPGGNISIVGTVPIDDVSCYSWKIIWSVSDPFTPEQINQAWSGSDWSGSRSGDGPASVRPIGISYPLLHEGTLRPVANARNDYLIDREAQRNKTFSGIPGVSEQDLAVQESMGPVCDRTREHLGSSDLGVIAARRRIMSAAEALEEGVEPFAARNGDVFHVRSVAQTLRRDQNYDEAPEVRQAAVARY
jgi:phenylpropionate dioxygenase-like ring-hydroxylating dioxygenase large terminal subunit